MTIAAAQYPITAHRDFAAWRTHTENWVAQATKNGAQLLVFPEYGSMELVSLLPPDVQHDLQAQVRHLETYRDDCWTTFAETARRHGVVIVAPSYPVAEAGRVVNRAAVLSPKGLAGWQDKFFMTRFEAEEWFVSPPPEPELVVFEADWGAFGIQICYDVEFAIGSQLLARHGAQLVVAPSCTETLRGATRVHVGARARSLENQCYVAVAQVVGEAKWSAAVDVNYGFAAVYATPDAGFPDDGILKTMPAQAEGWLVENLDFRKIETVRQGGQVLNFRDHRAVQMLLNGQAVRVRKTRV